MCNKIRHRMYSALGYFCLGKFHAWIVENPFYAIEEFYIHNDFDINLSVKYSYFNSYVP